MPAYTHTCKKHGDFEAVYPMSQAPRRYRCPKCHRLCARNFEARPTQMVKDDLGYSFKGDAFYGSPVIDSRSAANRALRESEKAYGKELSFDLPTKRQPASEGNW